MPLAAAAASTFRRGLKAAAATVSGVAVTGGG
jgi:hypothetical protein